MSTQLFARTSTTAPLVTPYRDHLPLHSSSSAGSPSTLEASPTDTGTNERQFFEAGVPADFWSGKVVSQHTQSGEVNFTLYGAALAVADADLRVRARLFKITAGGSDVESLLVTADATSSLTTTPTALGMVATMPASVVIVPGERYILRFYVFPFTGGWGAGSPVATATYDGGSDPTRVLVPVTVTLANNDGPLQFRRTETIGIIPDAQDLTLVRGSSPSTSVVIATSPGGTEIAWTRPKQTGTMTVTEITAAVIASTSNASTYVSASFTPVANRLYLVAVVHSDAAPETTIPTVATTTGLTFVQVNTQVFNTVASNLHRITLFRAMKASGLSAGTYTVTLADAGTGCAALLAEVTGMVTTGTDGADAVTFPSIAAVDAGANPSVTNSGYASVRAFDGQFAVFGSSLQTAPTAGTGFTGLSHPDYATPTSGLFAEYRLTPSVTSTCTLASSAWGGISVQLVAASTDVPLEWIGPRFASGWAAETANQFGGNVWAVESSFAANCGVRVKVFRRQPDGTESQIYTVSTSELVVFEGGSGLKSLAGGTVTPTSCQPDDRLVVRPYLINVGTMGGGATCTLYYDHDVADVDGDSFLTFVGLPEWKGEGDPVAPTRITDAQSLSGIGN